jgi:hypothetical protein
MEDLAMSLRIEPPHSPCLRSAAEAFYANVIRTASFAIMPAEISGFLISDATKHETETLNSAEFGIAYIDTLSASEPMQASLDALLSTVVLESWTAFECLASDLWAAAVDASPTLRKRLVAKLHKIKKPSEIELEQAEEQLPNPEDGLGSALKDNHQISFQKLPFIVANYKTVFGKQIRDVFYNTNDGYLIALAAVRNSLIHKAGAADAKFLSKVATFPEFSAAKHNERLKLDGEIVNKLRDAAIGVGTKLLAHVDGFLTYADDAA